MTEASLTVVVIGDAIQLTPQREAGSMVVEVDGWPVLAPVERHVATDADVQGARRADQR